LPRVTAAVDPAGARFAMFDVDGKIHLRDTLTGSSLDSFTPPQSNPARLSWSADGSLLAVMYSGDATTLHASSDWSVVATLPAGYSRDDAVFSPDGARIAVGTDRGNVELFTTSGDALRTINVEDPTFTSQGVYAIAWNPDGERLAVSLDDYTLVLNATTGTLADSMGSDAGPVAWSLQDKLAYVPSFYKIAIRDTAGNEQKSEIVSPDRFAWSPYGGKLAIGYGLDISLVEIRDLFWDRVTELAGHTSTITNVSWSRDGRTLVTTGAEGRILVWRLAYE
jgi:WD40 repeat protein